MAGLLHCGIDSRSVTRRMRTPCFARRIVRICNYDFTFIRRQAGLFAGFKVIVASHSLAEHASDTIGDSSNSALDTSLPRSDLRSAIILDRQRDSLLPQQPLVQAGCSRGWSSARCVTW